MKNAKTYEKTRRSRFKEFMKKTTFVELLKDIGCSIAAGLIVAFGLHCFSSYNGFVAGGITGIAAILEHFTGWNTGYFLMMLSLPIFLLTSIFVEKKLGFLLTLYVVVQSVALILFKQFNMPYYKAENGNLIFASIATGVITGLGYALNICRNGASGGTYAISSLVKHWRPAANMAWLSFALDSSVVLLVFFLYGFNIEATICTLMNLFIANLVVDYCLQGAKEGYKFEIITDDPETISQEIMQTLNHGVTEMRVSGMYTHKEKFMIICIIRKRELSKMMKLIKKYPGSFADFSRVNEVFGNFKK